MNRRIEAVLPVLLFLAACEAPFDDPATDRVALAATTPIVFLPDADARVEQAYPTRNFGTSSRLLCDGSPQMESFLRFKVAGAGSVASAKLRVYAFDATSNGPAVYATGSAWSEGQITWNTRPARTSGVLDDRGAIASGAWVELDVSAAVKGDGTYSFVLVPTSRDGVDFYSREGRHPPQLVVSAGATAPPPTGDTTPPAVSIASPAPGATYTSAQIVDVVASASDDVGVTKVEFFDNGVFQGTEDTSPFSFSWSIGSAQNGDHRWTAKAFDAAGNVATSAPVDVTVSIAGSTPDPSAGIVATVETTPVRHSGDAADDAAVWVHPTDPALSTIIGTDKLGGLAVYDLSGRELHYYPHGEPNNVDLRYDFPLGGARVALVAAGDKLNDRIRLYRVNPTTRGLEEVTAGTIAPGFGPYGLTMYRSKSTGKTYVFVTDNSGTLQQWELFDDGAGKVAATKVRQLDVGATTEGCVADDELGHLYIAEEDVAIWKYGTEPGSGTARTKVDGVEGGRLKADIEGLTIYYGTNGRGYLIASSQADNRFVVYDRAGANAFVTSFTIDAGKIDGVTYTDGIDVCSFGLGSAFPEGVFIAQDNTNDGANQNYKLVPWGAIAGGTGVPLLIDTARDPRK